MSYMEDPVEPIVGVHWRKKKPKPPEQGPPGIPGPPFPCGAYAYTTAAFNFYPNYFSPQNYGLYWLTQATDNETLVWLAVTTVDNSGFLTNLVPYLWGPTGVTSFTIKYEVPNVIPPGFTGTDTTSIDLRVYRNADPLEFNPCNDPYDDSITITGEGIIGELEIAAAQPNEAYDPIFTFVYTGTNCGPASALFEVQAHCAEEYDDDLPPQGSFFPTNDPGYVGIIIGPKGPGSIFNDPGLIDQ